MKRNPSECVVIAPEVTALGLVCTLPARPGAYRLLSVHVELTLSAAVGVRRAFANLNNGTVANIWTWTEEVSPATATNIEFNLGVGVSRADVLLAATAGEMFDGSLPDIVLEGNSVVTFGLIDADAGDEILAATAMLEYFDSAEITA